MKWGDGTSWVFRFNPNRRSLAWVTGWAATAALAFGAARLTPVPDRIIMAVLAATLAVNLSSGWWYRWWLARRFADAAAMLAEDGGFLLKSGRDIIAIGSLFWMFLSLIGPVAWRAAMSPSVAGKAMAAFAAAVSLMLAGCSMLSVMVVFPMAPSCPGADEDCDGCEAA